jgi:hypothetical protein
VNLLPDGRVLFYSFYSESLQPHIWDPVSNTFSPTAGAPYELFCSGHTSLADGRIFIAGGHIADFTGFNHALIYDPASDSFTPTPDMNQGRWYPTTTVLPNGDVLVTSGDINSNTNTNPLPQVFQMSSGTWRNLSSAQLVLPLYPMMFVAPNGKIFYAGPSRQSRYLDASGAGSWTSVSLLNWNGWRDYAPGVMYDTGKVLVLGGSDPPTATTESIDLNSASPAWTFNTTMHFPRRQHNAVLLPDGKVFVVGGSSGSGFDDSTHPVFPTEMWDPATGQFTVMASISVYRGYHSTALLLPDGRVLSAGGNFGGANAQIFSPPYLLAGARPTISDAPSNASYGQSILVSTPDTANIAQVTLLRIGSTTHTFDESQRFMSLAFTAQNNGLSVTMPASGNLAPPGYYMLFILNGTGVPSVAKIVQLSGTAVTTGSVAGVVTDTSGTPLQGAAVSAAGSNATTAADGTYTLNNLAPGTVTVTASLSGYQSGSTTTTVTAGQTTTAAAIKLARANPGSVSGTVVSSLGGAIAGATVSYSGGNTTTDSNGNYSLSSVPPGTIQLTASAAGFQSSTQTVNIQSGANTTANFTLAVAPSTGTVTGTITNASTGAVISGATVSWSGGSTMSNSSGVYTLTGVTAGTVQLTASAAGFQSSTQTVNVQSGASTTANFALAVAASPGTVTGQVTNISTGGVISGATVSWSGGSTTSNSSGVYTLTGVTAGNQTITATHSGYLTRSNTAGVANGGAVTDNFQLATAGKLTIKVKGTTGAAVSGAAVTVTGGVIATTVSGTTDSTGTWNSPWIAIGSYTITISKTGHTTQSKNVTASTGVTSTVTFTSF